MPLFQPLLCRVHEHFLHQSRWGFLLSTQLQSNLPILSRRRKPLFLFLPKGCGNYYNGGVLPCLWKGAWPPYSYSTTEAYNGEYRKRRKRESRRWRTIGRDWPRRCWCGLARHSMGSAVQLKKLLSGQSRYKKASLAIKSQSHYKKASLTIKNQ